MDNFIKNNKGPLIAMGSAAVGLVLLLLISALVNMPQGGAGDTNIWQSLFWLLFIGGGGAALVLFIRGRLIGSETDKPEEEVALTLADTPHHAKRAEQLKALFGTTDMNQITTGIQAMYAELEEWRAKGGSDKPDLAAKLSEQEGMIAALTNERDQAQAAHEKWQAKAISSTQEVAELREELSEHGKWQLLTEAELTAFFPTITIKDGTDHKAFLNSKRRQRRLMQRLSAEGYSILKKVK